MFLTYLIVWSFCICGMLMSACGATAHAIVPIGAAATGRLVYGIAHSLIAVALVRIGGFALFERMMATCIGLMFVTVMFAAMYCVESLPAVINGLLVPTIPNWRGDGIAWSVTLLAGVGGTVTMLCYGYWIREKGRLDSTSLMACRIDLATGYLMTALFGIAMVILGAGLAAPEQATGNVNLIMSLSDRIGQQIGGITGSTAGWMFRLGAWGAVFSSLLGVWQSVPALIGEMLPQDAASAKGTPESTINSNPPGSQKHYWRLLFLLGTLPALCLPFSLAAIQKTAGVTGALFLPLFALALLALPVTADGRKAGFRNGWLSTAVLTLCLLLFGLLAVQKLAATIGTPFS
jgi:hypothetical protein